MFTPEVGTEIDGLDTPCLVVELDVVDKNIKTLMNKAKNLGLNVRPHLKTAKSPGLARKMIEEGAIGICVAKVSEAEIMMEAGVDDMLITTEIVGEPKLSRLLSLATRNPNLKVVIDSTYGAKQLGEKIKTSDHPLQVLVDLNVGQNRCGVETKEEALELANLIKTMPNLQLIGVQGYEGHLQMMPDETEKKRLCKESMLKLTETAEFLRNNGFDIQIVSTGGTGTFELCAEVKGVTEIQAGSFIFMDSAYSDSGRKGFGQALYVLSTVISKPVENRAVIDAGMKSLSTDSGNARPHSKYQGVSYRPAGDEHGVLESADGKLKLQIGDKVLLVPSHIDTTVNLHENYYCMREGKLETITRISTRGKVQ